MPVRTVTPMPEEITFPAKEQIARTALRKALHGKLNCVGDVALTADGVATFTDIADPLITAQSQVDLVALDANAAATATWISFPSPGVARVNHAASALARTFRFSVLG